MDVLDEAFVHSKKQLSNASPLEKALIDAFESLNEEEEKEIEECLKSLETLKEVPPKEEIEVEDLRKEDKAEEPKLQLKVLPQHLKYVFLENDGNKLVIISSCISPMEEEKLIEVLRANKGSIGWFIFDLKGISPSY